MNFDLSYALDIYNLVDGAQISLGHFLVSTVVQSSFFVLFFVSPMDQ